MLKIIGLNSFEEEQKIDFERLTEKGLFGIFGPTGSGKSTILDAITIVLYGKVTRTNKGYINTTTKNLNVSYEFEIGLGSERKTYIAERNMRIDKHGAYKTRYARLIEKNESESNILADKPTEVHKQIEKIIGLTVEDFTRSVVLPQGKFSEFLKLTGKDRRDMLERIFALEKYGKNLSDKIKRARNKRIKEKNILSGELKKYEGLSEEVFKERKLQLKELIKEEESLIEEKKKLNIDYEKYKGIYELQNELKDYKIIEKSLEDRNEEISLKKESLDKAKKALRVKPFIDDLEKTNMQIKNNNNELKNLEIKLKNIDEELKATEKKYNDVLERKEKEIPELIKKEANLQQAIEINKKVARLKLEREELLKAYTKVKGEMNALEKKLNLILSSREDKFKNIEEVDSRLKKISVDPEYREKVQDAFNKEKEYKQLLDKKEEVDLKVKNKEKNIINEKKEYENVVEVQKKQNSIVIELENKYREIEQQNPGDNSLLLEKSEKVSFLREKLEKAVNNDNKKRQLEKILKEVYEDKNPVEEEIKLTKEKLIKKEKELTFIDEEIDYINKTNLASILARELEEGKACPVCGSIHHSSSAEKIDIKLLEEKQQKKTHIQEQLKELDKIINKFSIKLVSYEKEEEHMKNDLNQIEEELENIDLSKLKEEKEKKEREFIDLKNRLEKYNKEKNEIDNKLKMQKENNVKIDMKEAKLSEILKSEENSLEELKKDLSKENKKLDKASKEYLFLKKELKLEDITLKMQEIKKAEKESIQLQNNQRELRKYIDKMDKQKEELNNKIKELDIEISKILQSGKEKASIIKMEEEEFQKLSLGKNPEEYIEVVRKEIKKINESSDILKIRLEKDKKQRQEIWDTKLSLEQSKSILTNLYKEQKEKLEVSLQENNFSNDNEILKVLLDKEFINRIENEINKFEDEIKNVKNNIARIDKKLNGEFIEEDKWQEIKKDRSEKEKVLNLKIKEIATIQKTIEDMKKDIEDLKELKKKEKEIEHKLSLLNDLGKLVEGNKFVEFAAMNQLKYIAREASRRLKNITKDRYALEIDSEGNFTIRDDYNGGEIRETSTLSGGETFLTSLALALALSSQVQLKGSAPLEFFFLDEGFGTLDRDLLDIVMNSLERIHNSKFSVGIISHVEELKNRVPVKLIVTPAKQGEGGSKVKLEYS
ncbi:SbcC/MukB-like Walker B domain-containing protein [Clostridium aestuarii]|uniref:Nuclease SbcCD subunit C n=1 Tax=Clostridium aestuarii TaxID=338193 RepID=A0ABT4CWG1_9CLOT|nr:SbcC/MukB-like Walker B domain-containing protein [Clostridium aestuarii]MCY6483329.1 SbcC/MukB-like Walker B domain-containing protein [Clostridium aestuarii]